MNFKDLQSEMVAALKAGDKVKKNAISNLIAAIKKVAIDEGTRDNIPDDLTDRVILKELKSIKEQIDGCPAGREELKAEYQANYDIISLFAPKQLSAEEIKAVITEKFSEVLASGNRGMIMKTVMAELNGKADGKLINQVVAELCK